MYVLEIQVTWTYKKQFEVYINEETLKDDILEIK